MVLVHRPEPINSRRSVLRTFLALSKNVVADAGSGAQLHNIYASYQPLRVSIVAWIEISDRA